MSGLLIFCLDEMKLYDLILMHVYSKAQGVLNGLCMMNRSIQIMHGRWWRRSKGSRIVISHPGYCLHFSPTLVKAYFELSEL
jgi:hypothetical protein